MPILADTSALYAYVAENDEHHQEVVAELVRLARRRERILVTSYVLSETLGLIQHRLGWDTLERFMAASRLLEVAFITGPQHDSAWALMQRVRARHFTLVDASVVVLSRELGIKQCLALDSELARQGLELLP